MDYQVRSALPDQAINELPGKEPHEGDYDVLLPHGVPGSVVRVFGPAGKLLCVVVRQGLSEEAAEAAYPDLHAARNLKSNNRGDYAGTERFRYTRDDGSVGKTTYGMNVESIILGSFDRGPRFPFCRHTMYMGRQVAWEPVIGLSQAVAAMFRRHVPRRWRKQDRVAKATHPDWVIEGTPFTTLTVNNTVAAHYHADAGDLKEGFGCITVLRRGDYRGCELVFPKYRIAVDLQDRDILFFDPHQVHGNVPFREPVGPRKLPEEGGYERISVVLYYRTGMQECESFDGEVARANEMRSKLKVE